MEEENQSDG
jgi:hypothetical protein